MGGFASRSDIGQWESDRLALKDSNPFLYKLLGGDKATEYTVKNLGANASVKEAGEKVVGTVKGGFDIVSWIVTNWQISIVGGIAIILLIKRL